MARTDYGSHAYWRVQAIYNTFAALSAVLFKDDGASLIATIGGTAIESGHSSTFSSANLFDGTDATFWESDGVFNAWAGYHFATAKKVMQIALQRTASMDGSGPPTSVVFQYSDDGIVWGTAGWAHVGTLVNDTPKWFDLAAAL